MKAAYLISNLGFLIAMNAGCSADDLSLGHNEAEGEEADEQHQGDVGEGGTQGDPASTCDHAGSGGEPGDPGPDAGSGGEPGEGNDDFSVSTDPVMRAFCEMEASCIPRCPLSEESAKLYGFDEEERVSCSHPAARKDCAETVLEDDTASERAEREWYRCMSTLDCESALTFLRRHPDDVTDATPCAAEYFNDDLDDFEPRVEYGLR